MIIHNPILTGSFTVNGTDVSSITSSAASLTSLNAYTASQNILNGTYATTGSNTFAGIQTVNSNLVVTGSITAQTLVVQTVTSSVVYSSGSNVFGNNIANTQVFTGSMNLTGSLTVVTTGTEFQVNANGVKFGNVIGDAHSITGSVNVSGSAAFSGSVTSNGVLVAGLANGNIRLKGSTDGFLGVGESNGILYLADWATAAKGLQINLSTGAATFSSSVGVGNVTAYSILSLPSGNGWNGGLSWNFTTNGAASRRWWINTDQIEFGDFRICTEKTQGGGVISNASTLNERLYINAAGNVGIGTTEPSETLQVNSSVRALQTNSTGIAQFAADASNTTSLRCGLATFSSSAVGDLLGIARASNSFVYKNGGTLVIGTGASYPLILSTNDAEKMRIDAAGVVNFSGNSTETSSNDKFSMGFSNGAYGWLQTWGGRPLYLNRLGNNVSAFGSAGFGLITTTSSDVRIKKNIVSIESALDKVNALRGVYFEFDKNNELEVSVPHGKTRVGLIAQEVETIIPEAVIDGDNDGTPKSVDYTGLVGVLVKAIQELKAEIDELKNN
jgi:hypothetical protein